MTLFEPFAYTSGPRSAKIMLVGEAWGEEEDKLKRPFCGWSGQELFRLLGEAFPEVAKEDHALICKMMRSPELFVRERESWLESAGIMLTNTFTLRPSANKIEYLLGKAPDAMPDMPAYQKGKYFQKEYHGHIVRLWQEIESVRPNLVVALGNVAMWALTGQSGITARRGSIGPTIRQNGPKTLSTYHPAAILRNWAWRPILLADLMKAGREALFPEIVRPMRQVLVHPTLDEIQAWVKKWLGHRLMAVDIETKNGQITDIGFSCSRADAMCVTFVDMSKPSRRFYEDLDTEILAWELVRTIIQGPNPKLFQNGLYDLQYIARMGFRPNNCIEDTMLLHHALFPEMQKGLGFLGSVYTNEASWKLMRHNTEELKKDE
jgi:uracil-DNA glycosylase